LYWKSIERKNNARQGCDARREPIKELIAILAGNLVVQVLSLLVVMRAKMPGAGSAAAPGIVVSLRENVRMLERHHSWSLAVRGSSNDDRS
jgi:hypothetical protein